MKIDFAGTDLSGNGRMAGPDQYSIDTERLFQKSTGIRAVQQQVFARGNAATAIGFTITREHSTIVEAEIFANTHESTLPETGLLTLTSSDGGPSLKVSYLANAHLDRVGVRYVGQLTMANYRFSGGRLTTTKPKTT